MHRLAIASVALAFSLVASIAQAQQIVLTPHVALGPVGPAAADPAFETRTLGQLAPLKSSLAAGEASFFLKKARGPHTGRYAVFLTSPHANSPAIAAHTQAFPTLVRYELIGASKVGVLPTVDVLGVHYIQVKPGQGPAFEKFVTDKMAAAVGNLRPDLRFLCYKGANGRYFTIIAITNAARGKYWKNGDDFRRAARGVHASHPCAHRRAGAVPGSRQLGCRHRRQHVRGQGMGRLGAGGRGGAIGQVCGASERSERATRAERGVGPPRASV